MDLGDFKSSLKSGKISGAYIFAGEEDYLIRYYLSALREAASIDPALAVFNNPTYDGAEVDFSALSEAVKAPPMMADYKLIEWRHADFASMKERELDGLEALLSLVREHPYSVLAFTAGGDGLDFGTPKKPSAFVKRFDKSVNLLRFDRSGDTQLYAWLKKHFDSNGVEVTLDTVRELVFRSGHSMDVLVSEVEKLSAMVLARGRRSVTPDDVLEIASSTPECDTFALSNAILERNKQKAFLALEELKAERVDAAVVMGMISKTVSDLAAVSFMLDEGLGADKINEILKMNEYKLKIYLAAAKRYGAERMTEMLSAFANADAGSKFGGVTGYTAVELFLSINL